MKTSQKCSENLRFFAFIILFIAGVLNMGNNVAKAQTKPVKNIVVVYDILVKKDYHVSIVQTR